MPGTSIPQTAQTIVILCTGAILGPKLGSLAVALYLISGALGLPIFSEGGSGIDHLTGISGGYLLGFLFAACLLGGCKNAGFLKRNISSLASFLAGHALILTCGWAWMSIQVGMTNAYLDGVAPFYLGSIGKSLIALLIVKTGSNAKAKIERTRLFTRQ
ncbi:MAG: biotin transport system substrate-specific component [Pseudohongiellaceae bacterium]